MVRLGIFFKTYNKMHWLLLCFGKKVPGHVAIAQLCLMIYNVTINASTHFPSIQINRVCLWNLQQNALIFVLLMEGGQIIPQLCSKVLWLSWCRGQCLNILRHRGAWGEGPPAGGCVCETCKEMHWLLCFLLEGEAIISQLCNKALWFS